MQWEFARQRLSRWALDAVVVALALIPLPAQLGTRAYQGSAMLSACLLLVLLTRRRFPALAMSCAFGGLLILSALPPHGPEPVAVFCRILLLFVIAGTMRPEWLAWAAWAGGISIIAAVEITGQPRSGYGWSDFLLTSAICSLLFGAALLVSRPIRAHRDMAERALRAESDREKSATEAAATERTRITREMHDVVAHSLTVAVVQCVAASDDLDRGDTDRQAIAKRVKAAESACRDALEELRRMLGVLRFGTESLAPAPTLASLPELTAAISMAGVSVDLSLTGDLGGLPPGIELSCYRIVQEALTNTLKHSGARAARVVISGQPDDITVRVDDNGTDNAAHNAVGSVSGRGQGAGQGLIGMRERAAAYGGTLTAGPQQAGGYLVQAVLPRGERR